MQLTKVNYALVVYLALIEGLSLLVLDFLSKYPFDSVMGLFVGFIPAIIVFSIYRLFSSQLPIKLNGKEITHFPILYPSIMNAVFIEVLFLIQIYIPRTGGILGDAVFGLLSVLLASLILISIYNNSRMKITFELNDRIQKLNKISTSAATYAGIFEFFILPLMFLFYSINLFSFLNGLIAGLIGSSIGLWIVTKIIEKRPLELSL